MHLSNAELTAYATGGLDEEGAHRIELHLLECSACLDRLDAIDLGADPFVRNLRAADASQCLECLPAGWGDAPLPATLNRYQIEGEVGRGGMGVVYRAFDTQLRRIVALKVINPQRVAHPSDRTRFRREAEAAALLQHANIVQIFDFDECDGITYCAFEFVDGGSLSERLAKGPVTTQEAGELVAVLADALDYAHRRRLIHRDIKPANVLFTADGTPKIADFGLCRRLDEDATQTADGTLLGSPSYMAPEQARGDLSATGPAADIYSLGAVLYETLVGRPPFLEPTLMATLDAVRTRPAPPPSRIRRGVDRDLENVCLKCLDKSPSGRYANAAALAADLRRFLAGMPVSARRPALLERGLKLARRHPLPAAMASLLMVAVAAIVVILAVYNLRLQDALGAVQRNVCSLQIQRAAALAEADPDHAAALLTDVRCCPEALRDFAWRHVYHSCRQEITRLDAGFELRAAALAPDGKQAALGGADGAVQLWSAGQTAPARRLSRGGKPVTELAYHPARPWLAASDEGGLIRIWDLARAETPAVEFTSGAARCNAVAFAPQEPLLATAHSDGSIGLWDVERRQRLQTFTGHRDSVFRLAFNCQGTLLCSASKDETLRLWSVAERRELCCSAKQHGYLTDVRFHPTDPSRLASASNDWTVRLWSITPAHVFQERQVLRGFSEAVSAVAFSPHGETLAAGSYDHTVRLWNAESGQLTAVLRHHRAPVMSVRIAPDNGVFSAARDGQVLTRSVRAGGAPLLIRAHSSRITGLGYLPDGRTLLSAGSDGRLRAWDRQAGRLLAEMPACAQWITNLSCASGASNLAWECGGRVQGARFAAGTFTGLATLWQGAGLSTAIGLAPDGKHLAVLGLDDLSLINVTDAQLRYQTESDAGCLAFSPDGRRLFGAGPQGRLWAMPAEGGKPQRMPLSAAEHLRCVACSATSQRLAVGAASGRLFLCDSVFGVVLAQLEGHAGPVQCLAFSADGQTLASGGRDGEIRLWDAVAGSERCKISLPHAVCALAFAPQFGHLACGDEDGAIRIWSDEHGP